MPVYIEKRSPMCIGSDFKNCDFLFFKLHVINSLKLYTLTCTYTYSLVDIGAILYIYIIVDTDILSYD